MLIIGSLMTTRLVREERMLLDFFGEEYRSYMSRTNHFLPSPSAHSKQPTDGSVVRELEQGR